MRMLMTALLSGGCAEEIVYLIILLIIVFIDIVAVVIIFAAKELKKTRQDGESHEANVEEDSFEPMPEKMKVDFSKPRKKKHSGRCDGDCANCPPHYGYRHGRWYYGHNHIEGCVFGGNKGGGGRD